MSKKQCIRCHKSKPLKGFPKWHESADGVFYYCRKCHKYICQFNEVIRLGVTKVHVVYPYIPEEKLLYALTHPKDAGCRNFTGNPKRPGIPELRFSKTKEPKDQSSPFFLQNILGETFTIYFLYDPEEDLVKIGRTQQDLEARLASYPSSMILLAEIPDQSRTLENRLHKRFSEYRVEDTEWFEASDEMLSYIDSVLDSGDSLHMEQSAA